ncbi:DUF6151 family protein [Roseovarius salinarum]|uniref:DUF6151 family protein n=1 Tax=Roseovarius salinarum TaxID=1981892 RepID=UPI000C32B674|nr:DUF6151 family protein [Roseovarius salinarum]
MSGRLPLECRCGAFRLEVSVPGPAAGTRVACYCRDCQTAARHFGAPGALLGPASGTDIWQTTPDRIAIAAGAERLAILRLTPGGLFRWCASCCDTPVINTLPRLSLPFAGVVMRPGQAATADPVLGPVFAHAFTASAPPGAGAPARDRHFARAGLAVVRRMLAAWISGRARLTPLRGPGGGPVAPVHVLDPAARAAARPEAAPPAQ